MKEENKNKKKGSNCRVWKSMSEMKEAELKELKEYEERRKVMSGAKLKHDKMECSRRNIECLCKLISMQNSLEKEYCSKDIIQGILIKNVKILGNVDE